MVSVYLSAVLGGILLDFGGKASKGGGVIHRCHHTKVIAYVFYIEQAIIAYIFHNYPEVMLAVSLFLLTFGNNFVYHRGGILIITFIIK